MPFYSKGHINRIIKIAYLSMGEMCGKDLTELACQPKLYAKKESVYATQLRRTAFAFAIKHFCISNISFGGASQTKLHSSEDWRG